MFRHGEIFFRLVAVPSLLSRPWMRLEYGGQKASSLERGISRFRMIPQVFGSLEAERRVRSGITIPTTKPRSVTFPVEFQTVSNDGSKSWPSVHSASNCTPRGFVIKA